VVQTELDVDGFGSLELGFAFLALDLALVVLLGILLVFAGLGLLQESHLLVFFSLRRVFRKQFKKLTCLVFVNCVLELMDGGGDLESLKKNSLLTLNSDVFRPLDEPGEVSLWLDVSTDSKVASILCEQWTLHALVASLSSC